MKTIHILKNVLKRYLQMLLSAALATVITCVVIAVLAIMIFEAEPGSGNEMIEGFLTVWGVAMLWFALPCCGLWLFFSWGVQRLSTMRQKTTSYLTAILAGFLYCAGFTAFWDFPFRLYYTVAPTSVLSAFFFYRWFLKSKMPDAQSKGGTL